MKTTIKLAVASALVAAASAANAGIVIPAGDWTLDIGGVVNAYYTSTRTSGDDTIIPGTPFTLGGANATGTRSTNNITTGLLPNYLSVSGKTRQNDLDVAFTISINPGASTTAAAFQGAQQENRQAFLTVGDKSWGSVKFGKDLGIFASDAILSDMTLLGVGSGAGFLAGNTTTLGRIGSGYIYADWKSQISYTSPNWNGFQFTAGFTQAFDDAVSGSFARKGARPAIEAKASYEWVGDVAGKVWVSGITQKLETFDGSETGRGIDVGGTVNVSGFGLTAYYYDGKGIGTTGQFLGAIDSTGRRTDSDGGYVQGTYTIPGVGTKLGVSWGESNLEGDVTGIQADLKNQMWTVGAYHPLTKHLNLVAEYSDVKTEIDTNIGNVDSKAKTVSLGAILFF